MGDEKTFFPVYRTWFSRAEMGEKDGIICWTIDWAWSQMQRQIEWEKEGGINVR